MKSFFQGIVIFAAGISLLASCGKLPFSGSRNPSAMKLSVHGVQTRARVVTDREKSSATIYSYIEDAGFNIRAYATEDWGGGSNDMPAGIYVDPVGGALRDIKVTYDSGRDNEKWRITGNEGVDYADHQFSWLNGVPMNFFAYAPVRDNIVGGVDYSIKGTLNITKNDDNAEASCPFTYSAKAVGDEVSSANCDDLIFAYAQNTFESDRLVDGSDKFDILFHHAMAQIRFCVDPADFAGTGLVYVKLKGVEDKSTSTFDGIPGSGNCVFYGTPSPEFTWTDLGDGFAYSQAFNGGSGVSFAGGAPAGWTESKYGSGLEKTLYTCTGDVFFIIPQSLVECVVEVALVEGDGPVRTIKGHLPATTSGSSDVSWAPGYYYSYKIGKKGEKDDITLDMTLLDWAERENYIPIE